MRRSVRSALVTAATVGLAVSLSAVTPLTAATQLTAATGEAEAQDGYGAPRPALEASAGEQSPRTCMGPGSAEEISTQNLGTGSKALPVASAGLIDGTHYTVSRHLTPAVVTGFDTEEGTLASIDEIELDGAAGTGAWGATVSGESLYIGMGFEDDGAASIMRLNHGSGELEEAASLAPARFIWDMDTAPDGTIYAASSRQNSAGLWEFDPEDNDDAELLTQLENKPRQDARSVAATDDTVYVGLGNSQADLIAYDRETGEEETILPGSLSDAKYVYSLAATDDLVAVGTQGPGHLAVFAPESPEEYSAVELPSGTVQAIEIVDETVYFSSGRYLWAYQLDWDEPEQLAEVDPAGGQTRNIEHQDGVLHGAGSLGYVWEYDAETDELDTQHLTEAKPAQSDQDQGAARGERVQSLAATPETLYTGGHFTLGVRDLSTGELENVEVPGEPKDAVLVEDQLFMAMYSSGELVHYNPDTGDVEILAEAPAGHNRPRDLHYSADSAALLMAVQNDGGGAGSLLEYDLETGDSEAHEPFDSRSPTAVTTSGGTAYVAGSAGMQDEEGAGVVVALDLSTGEEHWRVELDDDTSRVTTLLEHGGSLYGMTTRGNLFSIDLETQQLTMESADAGFGDLRAHRGQLYGVTEQQLFRLDAETLEPQVLVDDLGGDWFAWPHLASDGCSLYVLQGTEVLQVTS